MTNKEIIEALDNNKQVFKSLLVGKTEQEYLWRPQPKKWNLLEIVCHLFSFRFNTSRLASLIITIL